MKAPPEKHEVRVTEVLHSIGLICVKSASVHLRLGKGFQGHGVRFTATPAGGTSHE